MKAKRKTKRIKSRAVTQDVVKQLSVRSEELMM